MSGGKELDLKNDDEILGIKSPKNRVGGPYAVVYKDVKKRWAIVAMDWDSNPSLGIRWFWDKKGLPASNDSPVWLLVPRLLSKSILSELSLDRQFSNKIEQFLAGDLSGNELN